MPRIEFLKFRILFLLPIFVVVISACGTLPTLNGATSSNANEELEIKEQVGTNGQLISIQSDNVRAAGYDEVLMVMTVQFDNGALYEYYGVPADLWTSFVAAQPHPWSQVGYPRLVQGGIPYKRIG
jgi:hypothetical protein